MRIEQNEALFVQIICIHCIVNYERIPMKLASVSMYSNTAFVSTQDLEAVMVSSVIKVGCCAPRIPRLILNMGSINPHTSDKMQGTIGFAWGL